MPTRPVAPLALAAWLATSLLASACGPGDPPSPSGPEDVGGSGGGDTGGGETGGGDTSGRDPGGGDAGGGDPGGGGDTGGGGTEGGDRGGGSDPGGSGAGSDGSAGGGGGGDRGVGTAWTFRSGGAGDEWVQDVAAAPGGAVVALTVIGPRGGGFDQLGLVRLGAGGGEQLGRLYDLGVPVRFPADGALSVGPGGEVYVALAVQCGTGCAALGGAVNGSALVQLSASGDPRWRAALPGDVVSQPVVDPSGNVAVASSAGGATVVRSYAPGGALRWEVSLQGAAEDVALASDAGSNVLVGRGSEVTKLAPGGGVAWSRAVDGTVAGLAGTASGAVVVAGTTPQGAAAVLVLRPDGGDAAVRPLPGSGGVLVEVGTGRRIGAVTGAPGCGSTVTALDLEGGVAWSRSVAATECDGEDLAVHAVTVTTSGAVVVAGALRGPVDLGRGRMTPGRTDGFAASFGP